MVLKEKTRVLGPLVLALALMLESLLISLCYVRFRIRRDTNLVKFGRCWLQTTAVDGDVGDNAKLVYQLLDNRANRSSTFDSSPFAVDPSTGVIRATASVDRELKAAYQFRITATDAGSPMSFTSTALVTVNILDVNDETPLFKV